MSKEGVKILHQDLASEHGFSVSWPKFIMPVMGPGKELDAINRKSIEVFAADMDDLRAQGAVRVGFWQWSRNFMVTSTTEAIWGPENRYRDLVIAEAWRWVQVLYDSAWGEDAGKFDHLRFSRQSGVGHRRPNRVAFRAFGGGHILCPGRHFASTEIMALAALLVLQFDIIPVAGKWVEPTWKNSPVQAGFPVPGEDINVEIWPRGPSKKWHVTFSGSEGAMGIVSEDITTTDEQLFPLILARLS